MACEYTDNTEPCNDLLFCNGAEKCVDGSCQAGGDPCPGQMCDEDTDIGLAYTLPRLAPELRSL